MVFGNWLPGLWMSISLSESKVNVNFFDGSYGFDSKYIKLYYNDNLKMLLWWHQQMIDAFRIFALSQLVWQVQEQPSLEYLWVYFNDYVTVEAFYHVWRVQAQLGRLTRRMRVLSAEAHLLHSSRRLRLFNLHSSTECDFIFVAIKKWH